MHMLKRKLTSQGISVSSVGEKLFMKKRRVKSRADRILQRLDQLIKGSRSQAKQERELFDELFKPANIKFDQLYNFDNETIHAVVAWEALRLNPSKSKDAVILKAFDAFGLDAKSPFDWKQIVYAFSDAHFGEPESGRKPTWDDFEYFRLALNFCAVKARNPELKDKQLRKRLLLQPKYKHLSDDSLRKLVAAAIDPRKNRYLDPKTLKYLKSGSGADPLQIVIRDALVRLGSSESSPNLEGWVKVYTDALREVILKPDREQVKGQEATPTSSRE
jgi:hypothetical protein